MDDKRNSSGHAGDRENGDKALWNLLGKARGTQMNPLFSRNVLREIRQTGPQGWHRWIQAFQRPMLRFGALAVLILIAGILVLPKHPDPISPLGESGINEINLDPAHEFESIERLGELMAVSDPGMLSDEALFALLY